MSLDSLLSADRQQQWKFLQGKNEATLARMAILRSLARELHSRRSKFLAQGAAMEERLVAWEKQLERLQSAREYPDSLSETLEAPLADGNLIKRVLPKNLFERLPQEKLERYDRVWEREIAAEALRLGWSIEKLETALPTTRVEPWQNAFEKSAFPSAIFIFVESAGFTEDLWKGRWWWGEKSGMVLADPV